jgi:hypothetical protein
MVDEDKTFKEEIKPPPANTQPGFLKANAANGIAAPVSASHHARAA